MSLLISLTNSEPIGFPERPLKHDAIKGLNAPSSQIVSLNVLSKEQFPPSIHFLALEFIENLTKPKEEDALAKAITKTFSGQNFRSSFQSEVHFVEHHAAVWNRILLPSLRDDTEFRQVLPFLQFDCYPVLNIEMGKAVHADGLIAGPRFTRIEGIKTTTVGLVLKIVEVKNNDNTPHALWQLENEAYRAYSVAKTYHSEASNHPFLIENLTPTSCELRLVIPMTKENDFLFKSYVASSTVAAGGGSTLCFAQCLLYKGKPDCAKYMAAQLKLLRSLLLLYGTEDQFSEGEVPLNLKGAVLVNFPLPLKKLKDFKKCRLLQDRNFNVLLYHNERPSSEDLVIKLYDYFAPESNGSHLRAVKSSCRSMPSGLLEVLKEAFAGIYGKWQLHKFGPTCQILEYPFIEGKSGAEAFPTWEAFLTAVQIVAVAHDKGFVHGDLLPQNVIFLEEQGVVLDWDFAGEADTSFYPDGYSGQDSPYEILQEMRHEGATAGSKIEYAHDVYSLVRMAHLFFEFEAVEAFNVVNASGLHEVLRRLSPMGRKSIAGSPKR